MNTSKQLAVAALLTTCLAGAAQAELIIQRESGVSKSVVIQAPPQLGVSGISGAIAPNTPPPAPPSAAPQAASVIKQIGKPGQITTLKGAGRKVTLAAALRDIVPAGWAGYVTDDRIKTLKTVDWYGLDRPWIDVLEHFLIRYDLVATIDWNKKEISLGTSPNFVAK